MSTTQCRTCKKLCTADEFTRRNKTWRTCNSCSTRSARHSVNFRLTHWWSAIISHSKARDKAKKLYIDKGFIDKDHLVDLRSKQDNKCYYCSTPMTMYVQGQSYCRTRLSIERKSNKYGHVKNNVVLACTHCNTTRSNRETYQTFYARQLPHVDHVLEDSVMLRL